MMQLRVLAILLSAVLPPPPICELQTVTVCTQWTPYCGGQVYRGGSCGGPVVYFCSHYERIVICK